MFAKPLGLSKQAGHALYAAAARLAAILVLVLSMDPCSVSAHAGAGPVPCARQKPAWLPTPRLSAGEDGPYLSLRDLQHRPRPSIAYLLRRPIKPPPMMAYPAFLRDAPIAPRTITTDTIAYLAQHEIRTGDRQKPAMALTFDCEAGTYSALKIVETLDEKNVKATFFVLGKYVAMFPDIVREIAAGGHEFGNHSFFHPLYSDITAITATQEITYTEAVLNWAVGAHVPMRYFRFPYGGRNDHLRTLVAGLGYQSVFWDLDPRGWEPQVTAADVVAYIRANAHNGGIVIMHCGCWDDAHALAEVIDAIREKGIEPGTLSSVLTDDDRQAPGVPASGAPAPP